MEERLICLRNEKKINVASDSNLGAQGWRLVSSPSKLEHSFCIFTRTVLVIYFKCQNTRVKTSLSRSMALSSAPKSVAPRSVAPRWCHVASMSTATLNRLAKLGAMTYGAETCYLGADPLGPKTQFVSSRP